MNISMDMSFKKFCCCFLLLNCAVIHVSAGSDFCSAVLYAASPIIQAIKTNSTALQSVCLNQLNEISQSSTSFDVLNNNLQIVFDECAKSIIDSFSTAIDQIAEVLGVTSSDVGNAILNGNSFEPLKCILNELSEIYPVLTSSVNVLNSKINELLNNYL
jgi:hypothetical protein